MTAKGAAIHAGKKDPFKPDPELIRAAAFKVLLWRNEDPAVSEFDAALFDLLNKSNTQQLDRIGLVFPNETAAFFGWSKAVSLDTDSNKFEAAFFKKHGIDMEQSTFDEEAPEDYDAQEFLNDLKKL